MLNLGHEPPLKLGWSGVEFGTSPEQPYRLLCIGHGVVRRTVELDAEPYCRDVIEPEVPAPKISFRSLRDAIGASDLTHIHI